LSDEKQFAHKIFLAKLYHDNDQGSLQIVIVFVSALFNHFVIVISLLQKAALHLITVITNWWLLFNSFAYQKLKRKNFSNYLEG